MKNRLGCGLNHSIVIAQDNNVYVWGSSYKDELGLPQLFGFVQNSPYLFTTQTDESMYSALEVSCGDSHSALLLHDRSLPKLKLIYSLEVENISKKLQDIVKAFSGMDFDLPTFHKTHWKSRKYLKRKHIQEFFNKFCDPEDEDVMKIIDLLMKIDLKSRSGKEKILFKEFRDQLHGARLDDGRVLTWGSPENGRLGREGDSPDRFVKFNQEVHITQVACGGSHCLAVSYSRKLFAWGCNAYGQLGIGHTKDQMTPALVSIDAEYLVDISGGGSHSIALAEDGRVFTWGLGEGGRLGHGGANIELHPRAIDSIKDAIHIAAGHSHSGCIIKGGIYTWGIGTYSRLGHGDLSDQYTPKMIEYFKGRFMQKICLSIFHSIALSSNGEVWAWGNSKNGRLGVPTSFGENQLTPARVGNGSLMANCKIIDIACGYKHGLALAKSGHLFAWGCGLDGKLGLSAKSVEEPIPKEVKIPKGIDWNKGKKLKDRMPLKSTEISAVSCSHFNTYALTNAGEVLTWGGNSKGQCGVLNSEKALPITEITEIPYATKAIKETFAQIPLLLEELKMEKIKQIASDGEYAIAVTIEGKVFAWGNNEQGQLGAGFSTSFSFFSVPTLLLVFKRTEIKSVSCGPYHSAFLAENGEVYMCGNSENGRLGLGDTVMNPQSPFQYIPRLILGLPNVKKIACGVSHTVAIDYASGVWAWGGGWFGKLGLGDFEDRIEPVQVLFKSFYPNFEGKLKEVACGEHHTLLLTADGSLYAAGLGALAGVELYGRKEVLYFNKVSAISQVKHVACGRDHTIVVTTRGQLYGWGNNSTWKIGCGVNSKETEEIIKCRQIIVAQDIIFNKVSAGSNHSAATTMEGVLYVWGLGTSGRLGLGFNLEKNEERKDVKNTEENEFKDPVKILPVKEPTEIKDLKKWFNKKDKEKSSLNLEPIDEDEPYLLQSMLKNESVDQSIETLLSQDQKIVARLEALLLKFDQVRKVQQEKENMLSYIESLIIAKIDTISSISRPDFKLTLPPIISKNFQLYEFLLACLQTHPCYMAKLVEYNPHLPTTEVAMVFKAIYGDMSKSPQKLRRLMQLYKLTLKTSVANTEFHRSMRMKAGDLSAYIYFYLLQSQHCNNLFYAGLTAEIMKIVDTASKSKKIKIPDENPGENPDENPKILEEDAKIEEIKYKIRDNLNYKQLKDLGDLPPELKKIYNARKTLFKSISEKIQKKILKVLIYDPKIRTRITKEQRLSEEVKFMYKDIPSVFRERFQEQCNSPEGENILNSKIVLLFFAPLVEMLREPIRLKRISLDEFRKSMGENEDFDEFILKHTVSFNMVADFIEQLGEWKKTEIHKADSLKNKKGNAVLKSKKQCAYLSDLAKSLTDVQDLNLTDLSLEDMLATSLEQDDSTLTISLEDICTLHILLKSNRKIILQQFGKNDPVYIIINSLGKVKGLFRKILSGDTKNVKLNLRLPTRWLLRERALQSCKECKTPLTYSLLRYQPDESKADVPLMVPTLWRCWNCGNTQDGWHMKCSECLAIRRDFPSEALFKNFKQNYISEELEMFTQLLYEIPTVPPHICPMDFMRDLQEKQMPDSYLLQKLKAFISKMDEIGPYGNKSEGTLETSIKRLDREARFEYELRLSHKSYLDSMNNILGKIEDKIKLDCLQFNQNTILTLRQASIAVAKGKNTFNEVGFSNKKTKRAQGRFTVDYLFKKKILDELALPETIKKNTSFYFTEIEDGAFDVRVVLREDRNYLCFPREPIEVKVIGFEIDVDKLKAMRRTMNFRARTSFENGKVVFNVFQFVRMLGSLLGKCKQSDFQVN